MKKRYLALVALFSAVSMTACGQADVQDNTKVLPVANKESVALQDKDAFVPAENAAEVSVQTDVELTQEAVFDKMLNTVNFFDTVQGRFVSSDVTAVYRSDLSTGISEADIYYAVVDDAEKLVNGDFSQAERSYDEPFVIQACDGNRSVRLLPQYKEYTEYYTTPHEANKMYIPGSKRVGTASDGEMQYTLIENPLNIDEASVSVLPQEITFGYLSDFDLWQIDGTEEYLGRSCIVLSGKPDEEYGEKLGVSDFVFYVDAETGVLLKYVGYDEDGNVSDYLITEEFKVNEPIGEVTLPELSDCSCVKL